MHCYLALSSKKPKKMDEKIPMVEYWLLTIKWLLHNIIQAVLKDVFDAEYCLNDHYASTVWSDLSMEVKKRLLRSVKNSLIACDLQVCSYHLIV